MGPIRAYQGGGSLQVTLQHGVHTSPTKYSLYLLYNREHGVIGYITFLSVLIPTMIKGQSNILWGMRGIGGLAKIP